MSFRIRATFLGALFGALLCFSSAVSADDAPPDEFAADKRALCDKYQGKVVGQRDGVDVLVTCRRIAAVFNIVKFESQMFTAMSAQLDTWRKLEIRANTTGAALFGEKRCAGVATPLPDGGFQLACTLTLPLQGAPASFIFEVQSDDKGRPVTAKAMIDTALLLNKFASKVSLAQVNDTMMELFVDVMNVKVGRFSGGADAFFMTGKMLTFVHRLAPGS